MEIGQTDCELLGAANWQKSTKCMLTHHTHLWSHKCTELEVQRCLEVSVTVLHE